MISVIVPAFNSEDCLPACLDALQSQDYAGDYEVIVVDDGSTDRTPAAAEGRPRVRLLRQANAGPAAARNRGAAEARGDVILFTDSDCVPEPDWLSEMTRPLAGDVVGVKGRYKTRQRALAARFVQLEYEDKYAYMQRERFIDFIDTYSAAFRKRPFQELGGYDTRFPVACAEDVDLSFRLAAAGHKMVFNPRACVYHRHPDTFGAYLRKKYKFAFWRMSAVRNTPGKLVKDSHTPQVMKLQLLFPPFILAALLGSLLWPRLLAPALWAAPAFLATTVPFAWTALRKDPAVGLLSPLVLFLRAGAQAAGVFRGALHAAARRGIPRPN